MVATNHEKLAKILHVITSQSQYGYKANLLTVDAAIKLEEYSEHATTETHIVLMDPTKAFGEVNRTILWTTLYKKEYP